MRVRGGVDEQKRSSDRDDCEDRQPQDAPVRQPFRQPRFERDDAGDDNRVSYAEFPTEVLLDDERGGKDEREPQADDFGARLCRARDCTTGDRMRVLAIASKFLTFPPAERRLLLTCAGLLLSVAAALRVAGFGRVQRWLTRRSAASGCVSARLPLVS